jgi:hypothetical protein
MQISFGSAESAATTGYVKEDKDPGDRLDPSRREKALPVNETSMAALHIFDLLPKR